MLLGIAAGLSRLTLGTIRGWVIHAIRGTTGIGTYAMAVAGIATSGGVGEATIVLGVLTTTTTIGDGITTTITTTTTHTTTTLCVLTTHISRRSITAHVAAHAMRDVTRAYLHAVARV